MLEKAFKDGSTHLQRIIINGSLYILTTVLEHFSIKLFCLCSSVTLNFVHIISSGTVTNRISNGLSRSGGKKTHW